MKFAIMALVFISAIMAQEVTKLPAKGDFRSEFDHLLVETAIHLNHEGENHLLHLQQAIDQLNISKSKAEQEKIIRNIDVTVANIEGAQRTFTRELERTDLNILERFNFEEVVATSKILIKDLREAEAKIKAVKTN